MKAETILGFDFGVKRIGVAVGNTLTGHADALTTIEAEGTAPRLAAVRHLVKEWQPARFVIGEPTHDDGRPHEMMPLVRKFGNRLHAQFNLPVEFVNEYLSSVEAERQLSTKGINLRTQKSKIDAVAAQVILQAWFDDPSNKARHAA